MKPPLINVLPDWAGFAVRVEVEPIEPERFSERYAALFIGSEAHKHATDYARWLSEQRAPASETGDLHPHEAARHLSSSPRRERTAPDRNPANDPQSSRDMA